MRKKLMLFILGGGIFIHSQGQIVITPAQMPKANDTFRYVNATPVNYLSLISQTGPSQFWVFPPAGMQTTSLVEYQHSIQTPYAFYFFNTVGLLVSESVGLGQYSMEDVYQFYSTSSSSYRIEGMGFKFSLLPMPLAGNYQVEDKVYHFPLEYGDRDSSNFKVSIQLSLLGSYSQSGYRITEVLGYGEIVVPGDTLECLMIRSDIIATDSVETQLGKFGFPSHRVEYKWLSLEHRCPVAEISGTELAGQFTPALVRYLSLKSNPGPGTSIHLTPGLAVNLVTPNPAQGHGVLDSRVADLAVYDLQGRLQEFERNEQGIRFHWPPGIYLFRFRLQDGSLAHQKVVVY